MSTRTGPTGAVKDAWSGSKAPRASPTGATAPSKSTVPSAAAAVMTIDAARLRSEVTSDTGDHVSIRSAPSSEGVMPAQV